MEEKIGFIILHRGILDWEWYDDVVTSAVFLHLMLTARFKPTEWHRIRLEPGQTVTSRKKISAALGLSEGQVRTALANLKSTGEITIESTNKYSVITLMKWGKYQGMDLISHQPNDQQTRRQATGKSPQQNNVNNVNNVIRSSAQAPPLKQIVDYVEKKHLNVDARKFLNYYNARGWTDKRGRKISDWKNQLHRWHDSEGKPKRNEGTFAAYDLAAFEESLNRKD